MFNLSLQFLIFLLPSHIFDFREFLFSIQRKPFFYLIIVPHSPFFSVFPVSRFPFSVPVALSSSFPVSRSSFPVPRSMFSVFSSSRSQFFVSCTSFFLFPFFDFCLLFPIFRLLFVTFVVNVIVFFPFLQVKLLMSLEQCEMWPRSFE